MKAKSYKVWVDSDVIHEGNDLHAARIAAYEYLSMNPQDQPVLHFAAFRLSLDKGAEPLFTYKGDELVEFLQDEQ